MDPILEMVRRGEAYIDLFKRTVKYEDGEELQVLGKSVCDQLNDIHKIALVSNMVETQKDIMDNLLIMSAVDILLEDGEDNATEVLRSTLDQVRVAIASAHHEAMHAAFQLGISTAVELEFEMEEADED